MRILVRVAATQASAEIARLEAQVAILQRRLAGAAAAGTRMNGAIAGGRLERTAKDLQYTGRQIGTNFTLPLVIAAGAATKFALDNETAMTRVKKVYGDGSAVFSQLSQTEIPALARAFRELSDEFGVNQAEVINIAADWAAAGASGVALARATRLTMETMVLGELDAASATKALISIQAQYGLVTETTKKNVVDLKTVLGVLNMVENQTGASFGDLVTAFSKSAGAARASGVDVQHLAAQIAALVPAAGSAANAGNALKTIYSRLIKPTADASAVMKKMGIDTDSAAYQSLNLSQRLELVAKKYTTLVGAQKPLVASTLAGVFQFSRMSVLLTDIANKNGYYQRSLKGVTDATGQHIDKQKVMNQYYRELGQVLSSDPQRFKILYTQLQNMLAQVVVPLLPALLALANSLSGVVRAFTNMNPVLQKMFLLAAFGLAVFGPLIRYVGAFGLLGIKLYGAFMMAGRALGFFATTEVLATGETVVLRTGLGRLIGELGILARMPFSLIAGGFRLIGLGVGFIGTAFQAIQRLTVVVMRGMLVLFSEFVTSSSFIMARTWVSNMIGSVVRAMGGMFLALGRGLLMMLIPIVEFGGRSLGLFTFIWNEMLHIVAGAQRAIIEAYYLGQTALQGVMLVGQRIMIAIMTAGRAAMIAVWEGLQVALAAVSTFGGTLLVTITEGVQTALATVTRVGGAAMVAIWEAVQGAMAFVSSVLGPLLVRIYVAMVIAVSTAIEVGGAAMVSIWESVQIAMMIISSEGLTGILTLMRGWIVRLGELAASIPEVLAGPVGWALLAVVAIFAIFHKQIMDGIHNLIDNFGEIAPGIANFFKPVTDIFHTAVQYILDGFNALPQGVQNAFIQVVKIVESAAMAVYNLFSYFNPFAHHSPSLVENVIAGVDLISKKYATLNGVGVVFRKAIADMKAFGLATADAQAAADRQKVGEQRADVVKYNPSKVGAFDTLDRSAQALVPTLRLVGIAFAKQEAITQTWKSKLDGASTALDGAKAKLKLLQAQADTAQAAMDAMNGTLETLNGQKLELAQAGAGSDITGPIQAQIDQITKARDQLNTGPIAAAAAQQGVVDKLQSQFDMVQAGYDAEKSKLDDLGTAYDAIKGQIDDMTQAMSEFASISKSISSKPGGGRAKGGAGGSSAFDTAGASGFPSVGGDANIGREGGLGDQSKLIDQLTNDWTSKASKAFGNFDILSPVKRKLKEAGDWIRSHVSTTIGAGVGAAIGWAIAGPFGAILGAALGALIGRVFDGKKFAHAMHSVGAGIQQGLKPYTDWIVKEWKRVVDTATTIWSYIGPSIMNVLSQVWTGIKDVVAGVIKEFSTWGDLAKPATDALGNLWTVVKSFFKLMIGLFKLELAVILFVWKNVFAALGPVIKPIFAIIKAIVVGTLRFIHGFIKIVLALIGGDWSAAWDGLKMMLGAVWDIMKGIVTGGVKLLLGIIKGLLSGVKSVATDLNTAITSIFGVNIWDKIKSVTSAGVNGVIDIINGIAGAINSIAGTLHIGVHIPTIGHVGGSKTKGVPSKYSGHDLHATGTEAIRGSKVGGGWVTDGIRAIVGEGNRNHPEFVIPTDPAHRKRALMLYNKLGAQILGTGDVLGNIAGKVTGTASAVGSAVGAAAGYVKNKAVDLGFKTIDGLINKIHWPFAHDLLKGFEEKLKDWAKGIKDPTTPKPGPTPLTPTVGSRPVTDRMFAMGGYLPMRVPAMANGGIVYPRPGGTLVRVGEAGQRERIEPLNGKNSSGKHITFTGDLSFPNIKSGADAEDFLRNLDALVGD